MTLCFTTVSSQSKDEKGQMQPRDKKPSSSFKRNSLVQLGRVKGQEVSEDFFFVSTISPKSNRKNFSISFLAL